jgi:putative transposase
LANDAAHTVLAGLWTESLPRHGWAVGRYVVMPDHVHLFARCAYNAKPLARWIQTWKSLSSRAIAASLGVPSSVWQRDYFDRFLRSADNYTEKWHYVVSNPVRKGLVKKPDAWRWQGVIHELAF